MPDKVSLDQNYPNPFNPSTSIRFYVETISNTSLELFDINGKLVDTLVDKMTIPGEYNIVWDGSAYSSGIYIARLNSGSKSKSVKMLLLK